MMLINGNNATGRREVTARGTASVIHQVAISRATARVAVTAGSPGFRSVKRKIYKKNTGPEIKPMVFRGDAFSLNRRINPFILGALFSEYRLLLKNSQ
jgi:hypothetical protein